MQPSQDRGKTALYVILMEPARLALNVIWYSVSIVLLRRQKDWVLRWLTYGVTAQMSIALYLYLALYDLVPVPDIVVPFLSIYRYRQAIWVGNVTVFRMAGTFFESPPFSLFMFCCCVVFALRFWSRDRDCRPWFLSCGFALSLIGSIMGFASQVLLALPVFGLGAFRNAFRNVRTLQRAFAAALSVLVLCVGVVFVAQKISASGRGQPVYGSSVAERSFHSKYAIALFIEQPMSSVFGIGPGRYGDYVARTGLFPSTVTLQVTPIEWLVEYGCLGCLLLAGWFSTICKRSFIAFGSLGVSAFTSLLVAIMFQASWKWEGWFFAMAFLYVSGDEARVSVAEDGADQ
jgi:hypothetical protein